MVVVMMVPFESAWRDDSNGGHIVKFDYFDLNGENPSCGGEFDRAEQKVDLFLAWSFDKKSSNQADYTPNR